MTTVSGLLLIIIIIACYITSFNRVFTDAARETFGKMPHFLGDKKDESL
jgi:hypothetical protein